MPKVFVGNGASEHLQTTWYLIGLKMENPFAPFANSALLTAMGNDLGFDDAFLSH